MKATVAFAIFCWITVVLVWVVSAFSVKPTKERQRWLGRLIYLWFAVVAAVLLNGAIGGIQLNRSVLPHTLAIGVVGDGIIAVGLLICIWARVVLGSNWSSMVTLKENHELVQRGPYRLVRHPIYSGLLLMILGTAVLAGRLSGFFALLICFWGLWLKLQQEEVLLTRHLPGYREYLQRTKALVPFVL